MKKDYIRIKFYTFRSMIRKGLFINISNVRLGLSLAVLLSACSNEPDNPVDGVLDVFPSVDSDPSIKQIVELSVDYSAFKTYGPVFFGVYAENPFIIDEEILEYRWNEDVKPIYEDYTEENGKFEGTVELPEYLQHLYIATGNFFTGMMLLETDIKNGKASVIAENNQLYASASTHTSLRHALCLR